MLATAVVFDIIRAFNDEADLAVASFYMIATGIVGGLLRRGQAGYVPAGVALWLGIVAVVLALVTAWLGGELVERLGVEVDEGANLDAPSSLSGSAQTGRPQRTVES